MMYEEIIITLTLIKQASSVDLPWTGNFVNFADFSSKELVDNVLTCIICYLSICHFGLLQFHWAPTMFLGISYNIFSGIFPSFVLSKLPECIHDAC